ncbi:MAG: cation:proton antiporter [Candidatus Marinimicrobia bacterium]|jgi:Kef-type K+ transport system membrane component KefB/CBS domain-containing protein|nr:cation:proton antiporter [Candidatus Neomarinimicrobiota bacterium]
MNISYGILLIFGISIFGGLVSAFAAKKMKIPQVIGYIITGIIIGESGFKIVSSQEIIKLAPFNFFVLGIIGFLVGAEIKFSTMKKYGKQFSAILLSEGLFAFALVGFFTGLILYIISGSFSIAIAGGMVFGAIASATDPASTLNVLQEYRAAGILTTTVIVIVVLDDALAMTLYGLGSGIAQIASGSDISTYTILFHVMIELFGSIAIGIFFGYIINYILHKSKLHGSSVATSFGLLLLCIGIINQFDMDVILSTMAIGITVVNKAPKRSKEIIQYIKSMSTPIYILFFVLVGARLQLNSLPSWLWLIVGAYVIFRSIGKYFGSWLGATIAGSNKIVRKFTGLSLFSQGGVAIGLSIMASQHLNNIAVVEGYYLGDVIIFGVTATTFILQIIGPPTVKMAAILAKETGKNISTEDILNENKVSNNLITNVPIVNESTTLRAVFDIFAKDDLSMIPVLGNNKKLVGGITIKQLRESLTDQSAWDWLLASDFMEPIIDYIKKNDTLFKASSVMEQLQTDFIPVLDGTGAFAGIITKQKIKERINHEKLSLMNQ